MEMLKDVLDIKRLPGSRFLAIHDRGKVDIVDDFKPYCFATDPGKVPFNFKLGEKVTKKCFWNNEPVITRRVIFNTPNLIYATGKRARCTIFEGDIDFNHRFALDKIASSPPKQVKGVVYDTEFSGKKFLIASAALATISFEKGSCSFEYGKPFVFEDPEHLVGILDRAVFVCGHYITKFDNEMMAPLRKPTLRSLLLLLSPIRRALEAGVHCQ